MSRMLKKTLERILTSRESDELISAIGNFDLKQTTSTRSGSGETVTTNGLSNGVRDLGTSYTTLLRPVSYTHLRAHET